MIRKPWTPATCSNLSVSAGVSCPVGSEPPAEVGECSRDRRQKNANRRQSGQRANHAERLRSACAAALGAFDISHSLQEVRESRCLTLLEERQRVGAMLSIAWKLCSLIPCGKPGCAFGALRVTSRSPWFEMRRFQNAYETTGSLPSEPQWARPQLTMLAEGASYEDRRSGRALSHRARRG